VTDRWQRRIVTTDSSAEQRLEVGCSVRLRRAGRRPTSVGADAALRFLSASAEGPRRSPSGVSPGLGATDGGMPLPRGLDCPQQRHRFGVGVDGAISRGRPGRFGPRRALCSMTWGSASADRSIIASEPLPRTPVPAHRGMAPGHPGSEWRRASALRSAGSTGARQPAVFGPPGARLHRGTATGGLRATGRTAPPASSSSPREAAPGLTGHGNRRSSGHRAHGSTGARQPAVFGPPGARLHRDSAIGTPRGAARRVPPGSADLLGGPVRSPKPRPPHRTRQPARFGAPRASSTGPGNRRASAHRAPRPPGPGNRRASAHRAPVPPGRPPSSSGPCGRRSSEHRERGPTATGAPDLFGGPGQPASARAWPVSRGTGHPAPRGWATGDPGLGIHGSTPLASAGGGRHGRRLRSAPTPGRTVTARRQGPQ
jgi:hypothetical protein